MSVPTDRAKALALEYSPTLGWRTNPRTPGIHVTGKEAAARCGTHLLTTAFPADSQHGTALPSRPSAILFTEIKTGATLDGSAPLLEEEHRGGGTLVDALLHSFRARTDSVAVECGDDRLTYAGLDLWSDAVRAALGERGVRPGDRVAVRLAPGPGAIAAIAGIVRAGAAYVPLDVRNPPSRNAFILQDCAASALIGAADDTGATGLPVLSERDLDLLRTAPPAPPGGTAPAPAPEDTAYVIYTSGTTGRPKGVPVTHEAVTALLGAASGLFTFTSEDRWLLFHSLAFDFAVWEMWGALATGARLVVLPQDTARSAESTLAVVADRGVTVLNQTPTAFAALSATALASDTELPGLRYVVFGGEKLTPGLLRPWAARYGLAAPRLVNMYGITEVTVHATYHEVTPEDLAGDDSCVGRPLPGFRTRVVGEDGRDAERGELWLAGPQVTHGYLGRPELDAERFVTASDGERTARYYRSGDLVSTRPDGALRYHGRADLQVKLRGHRIELSEIEAVVRDHPRVSDAVVWVHTFRPGDERLVCAFTTTGGEPVEAGALHEHTGRDLPSYMRPARFLHLPELPRTVNGKVDRAAVALTDPAPRRKAATAVDAASGTETYLSRLWEELLGSGEITRDADFFQLGGHSLMAFRMQMRISRDLGVRVPQKDLLANPRLADVVRLIDARRAESSALPRT
ncbi:amino acid adenylation domain-containing protein [Streptomyces sp. BV129]|uniref:amino acid adenylation domain-containing protein n=1 Tax=Streptomyces sp. BV129 TaxID=2849671 RepID=UPI0027E55E27|nr:amino acid adenylation domain-containing protein [Streptomyces sp. BV129]